MKHNHNISTISKGSQLYSGKAKTLFTTDDPSFFILHFRDDTSAFNGVKLEKLPNKGKVNNQFNALVMQTLEKSGIKTHFERLLSADESLVKRLDMIPVECVVRNKIAGGLAKRLGVEEGGVLSQPIFEFFLKNDSLNDPMINEYHIQAFGWAEGHEINTMKNVSFQVNDILKAFFKIANLELIDFKLEFGRCMGSLILGDEITPDGCRIWDMNTLEKLDKDRFRRDLGGVVEAYEQVTERLLRV